MRDILTDTQGDQEKLGVALEVYVAEDMEAAMQDMDLLQGLVLTDMTTCFDRVSEDYEDLYTSSSEEEILEGLLEAMEDNESCQGSLAFMKLGIASSQEGTAQEEIEAPTRTDDETSDHNTMASEVCSCITSSTELLSPRMKSIFIESKGDTRVLDELIQAYAAEDPETAMKDATLLQGDASADIDKCMERIELDYETIFESDSKDNVLINTAAVLEQQKNCELSAAIIRLAVAN
jgi:hypothetical protein